MPEMTETKTPGRKPKKKKNKESHNAVERHRKEKINAGINRIGNLLPCSQALKQSKNMILDQAFHYITELQKQNDTLLLEGGDKVQAEEIRRLRRQVDDLRMESAHYIELLKAHDISLLEDPTAHWKGKHRCAKVAKVTPTHQPPKSIVVYSNGNLTGKQASPGKKPSEINQPSSDTGLQVNGALLQVNTTSTTPALLPGSAAQPTSGLRVLEQCVIEAPAVAPSVSYITLQIPAAPTSLLQQAQPDPPPQTIPLVATSASQHPTDSNVQSVCTRSTSTQTMTSESSGGCTLMTQDSAIRTVSYTAVPANQTVLRAGAAGSTQTTWTTLQMTGNTVHPVCQSLSAPEVSGTSQAVQQFAVCPAGSRPSVNPVQIQLQPHVPVPHAPITTHIPANPFKNTPQLQPAVLNHPQPVLNPQPQCAVLPQTAIVPQPAVLAHPAVMSQPQATVLQPASLVPHPPAALIPQPQQTLVPQHQAAVLPLLQTMQVLQVNPATAAASGVTAPQSTNNPSVVILQQASACPAQQVVREDISNPTPCQHIVIIQAPSQAASAPQSSQLSIGPPPLPAVTSQTPTTTSSVAVPPLQSVGGKQLVHILPRPTQPEVTHPLQVSQGYSSPPVSTAPQTITVNGQVFALKPVKTSDKSGSQIGQSTMQLVQPTTTEEPTTNVALNSLGALSSLNQSISQGIPLSSQSSCPLPPTSSVGVIAPVSGATPVLPAHQLQVQSGLVAGSSKPPGKKPHTAVSTKRAATKRTKPAKKKEPKAAQLVFPAKSTANAAATGGESQTIQNTASQVLQSKTTIQPTVTTAALSRDVPSCVTSGQNTLQTIVCTSSSSTAVFSPVKDKSSACGSPSESAAPKVVSEAPIKPPSNSALVNETKTNSVPRCSAAAAKALVSEVNRLTVSTTAIVTQSMPPAIASVSKQNKSTVTSTAATDTLVTSAADSSPALPPVCIQTSASVSPSQNTNSVQPFVHQKSKIQDQTPSSKPESQPSISASPASVLPSPTSTEAVPQSSVTVSTPTAEIKKKSTVSKAPPPQQTEVSIPQPSLCHPVEAKPPQTARTDQPAVEERPTPAPRKEGLVGMTSEVPVKKDSTVSQQVYTNLDEQTVEQNMTSNRQADSPLTTGAAGGRGFSVASMLPQGQSIGASSGSFGSFAFTSEQAEMLALAMLEQDSPERKSGGCSGDGSASATWDSPKTPPLSANRDRASTGQQAKISKMIDQSAGKHVEASVSGPNRQQQNTSYSKSQALPPGQSQNTTQGGTAASLSVNNLIRPSSSSHQAYPSSPSLTAQQGSVPSPAGTTSHMSQPPNNAISPCSGTAQVEYNTLKGTSIRNPSGNVIGERHVKIISKRQAQEEVMLNTGKRPKPCPPTGNAMGHMDVKAPDHSQMMVGQLPSTSAAVMSRINPESGGPLFSTNSFMSSVVRPTDGHCPTQGPPEQNQAGGLHLSQGHPQHAVSQSSQHLGGNLYMKQQQQQQQEQQRHHLYHLQHHLTQSDPAQRHSIHQRALQEQQQHVQKKRGIVRGNQTGSPAGLQQKQHHLEKTGLHQHSHQQQSQHPQQSHQQSQQQHQQQTQHHQQQQAHQQPPQTQHQLQQQQNSHPRHPQHLQQQIQQQHFRHQEKTCEAQSVGSRGHHNSHLAQQDHLKPGQDHNAMQRMMSSRSLEQQLISPPTNAVSRSSELACAPSRQERHRVSNYSAEALIGKSSTSSEQQQRMALLLQPGRGATQEQPDLRNYLDTSRAKAGIAHNPQNRLSTDHSTPGDQRISECQSFKVMGGGGGAHQLSGFEVQVSRGSDMAPKSVPPSQRGPQGQQQGGFRMSVGPSADVRNRGNYSGPHPGSQGVQVGPVLPREQEGCHQSFMQSLLSPHLPEQSNHQRAAQCCPPVSMEYSCVPGSSAGDIQAKASSPSVPQSQKAPAMRLAEANKGHISQVTSNMHAGPGVRSGLPHPPTPHSSSEPGRSPAISRPPTAVSQHSRHIPRDAHPAKLRPSERPRSGALRPTNPFEPEGHLPLPSGGGVLLGRPQSGGENRRSTIVRFMSDSGQVPSENNIVADQHLAQNFGFPFIPEGSMNPPPPINANSTFIPPVSQPSTSRTPSLLPVEPQNTLPSFYPSYSPAAHPSLSSDVTLQYFPNQMFTSPSADKASAPPLNNRFGSILSPPRPVGFAQASFPLLPEMPPMPSSGITPHISNFSLTSLFPEIATGMPTDGSAMPMSPLLSLTNTSSADSGKQPNRPAHNISHILGHDGSSAV